MSSVANVIIAIRTISELLQAVERATREQKDITEEQLKAATADLYSRLKASDKRWQDAGK